MIAVGVVGEGGTGAPMLRLLKLGTESLPVRMMGAKPDGLLEDDAEGVEGKVSSSSSSSSDSAEASPWPPIKDDDELDSEEAEVPKDARLSTFGMERDAVFSAAGVCVGKSTVGLSTEGGELTSKGLGG